MLFLKNSAIVGAARCLKLGSSSDWNCKWKSCLSVEVVIGVEGRPKKSRRKPKSLVSTSGIGVTTLGKEADIGDRGDERNGSG